MKIFPSGKFNGKSTEKRAKKNSHILAKLGVLWEFLAPLDLRPPTPKNQKKSFSVFDFCKILKGQSSAALIVFTFRKDRSQTKKTLPKM